MFYDEDKEDLHARVDDIKREMGRLETNKESATENLRRAVFIVDESLNALTPFLVIR